MDEMTQASTINHINKVIQAVKWQASTDSSIKLHKPATNSCLKDGYTNDHD